ncbi:MAG: hypothetical protein AB7O62_16440 [Pirellulales bacterium]
MNALLVLCAALLAADPTPAAVSVRVLLGTADESDQTDCEPWISQAVAEAGSPLTGFSTAWIELTGEEQRIYTSPRGGCVIHGQARQENGGYKVKIEGCDGGPLEGAIALRPGQRHVFRLTDYPTPANIFVAMEAPLSEQATKLADEWKSHAQTFRLELNYDGEQDKPFYRLIVSVPPVVQLARDPFCPIVQIDEDEAAAIIDHLSLEGFFDQAVDPRAGSQPQSTMPGYSIKTLAEGISREEDIGWGLPMIERLDRLRKVLPINGQRDIDLLLARLSGLRKQWEGEKWGLDATLAREGSRVRFAVEGDTTVINVTNPLGIDKAVIKRLADRWPESILVRLHLGGLESFRASLKGSAVEWSVSSSGDHAVQTSLVSGLRVAAITPDSPYYGEVRIIGGGKEFPLKNGYFEVRLPGKLFAENPAELTLEWIDFYRE